MISRIILSLYLLIAFPFFLSAQKKGIIENVDLNKKKYIESAQKIWDFAEVGYQEEKSSAELISLLKEEGFVIKEGVADIPTAFIAEYNAGGPIVAILGEYDALPGLSQTSDPEQKKRKNVHAGHACGHNLFGVASAAAAISVKKWLEETKNKGTVRFYGCPAEEGGSGKVYMLGRGYLMMLMLSFIGTLQVQTALHFERR